MPLAALAVTRLQPEAAPPPQEFPIDLADPAVVAAQQVHLGRSCLRCELHLPAGLLDFRSETSFRLYTLESSQRLGSATNIDCSV